MQVGRIVPRVIDNVYDNDTSTSPLKYFLEFFKARLLIVDEFLRNGDFSCCFAFTCLMALTCARYYPHYKCSSIRPFDYLYVWKFFSFFCPFCSLHTGNTTSHEVSSVNLIVSTVRVA